ncbi:DUF368 domain-containing protein [Odoribacter lunatus]|uniref:DUF368 domain-containing protein n=1 Tax=Odoribacter lunatus TaxID=2941335 RepID=UPI00203C3817|nr:DUF368 domain-containing protein [Odoribacter lunatus]
MGKQRNYLLLVIKGCCMGAADVVPGVSGGTIAFITGIYEELIYSIKSFDLAALKLLFQLKFKELWKKINGSFLLSVLCGIGISIFSLAKLMNYLLTTHPIEIWSFFFGLIIASALLISKEIQQWNFSTWIALIAGGAGAYTITILSPASTPETWWFIMLSGAIAICAMILPGISGAFILLLLGKYSFIMEAISELHLGIILLFAIGAVIGIISFSHFLSWLLKNHHALTIALLTGFMLGSLNKVWPWKETSGLNVLPDKYATQSDPFIGRAVLLCLLGFFLIQGIEYLARKLKKQL